MSDSSPSEIAIGNWAGLLWVGNQPTYFVLGITNEGGGPLHGTIRFPRESEDSQPLSKVDLRGSVLRVEATKGGVPLVITGDCSPLSIRARYLFGTAQGSTTLLPLRALPRNQLLPYTGDYADKHGDSIVVAESLGALYYFNRRTGRTGRLYPLQTGRFFGGPTWLIFQPAVVRADFSAWKDGKAQSADFLLDGERLRLSRQTIATEQEVQFAAPGATIAGTLRRPPGRGPFPAVLLIAGSNGQPRSGFYAENDFMADHFARLGFLTFTFDKRGVGQSTGASGDNGAEDVAAAAFRFLLNQPEVDQRRTGIWGISQGGILAPKVASMESGVQYIISVSGAVVDANTQEIERTELQLRADGFSEADIANAVAFQKLKFHYARTQQGWAAYTEAYQKYKNEKWFADPYVGPPSLQTDPAWQFWRETGGIAAVDYWRKFQRPVLVLYSEHEVLSSSADNIALFVSAMRDARNNDFAIIMIPGAEHSMLRAANGGFKEARSLTGYSLRYFRTLSDWLRLQGLIDRIPAAAAVGR